MENELHEKFKAELSALLKKYDAEILVQDFGKCWSPDEKIVVDFNSIYGTDNDRPYSQLILGTYFD